ncbi:MAG: hypothetical protein WC668_04285 [Patescibacteria group bacterium]|jgi:hypothetical protein
MNSKIFKKPYIKVEITDTAVSGSMLFRKLGSWCEAESSVLMWETTYEEAPLQQYFATTGSNAGKKTDTAGGNWRIEFQFVRVNTGAERGFFDGAIIIAGFIKNTLEATNDESQPAYLLSINSRSLKGEQTFLSAPDLWKTLTNLGVKKT